jgi:hypothetical protein
VDPGGIEFSTVAVVYARRVTVGRGVLASTFEFASHSVWTPVRAGVQLVYLLLLEISTVELFLIGNLELRLPS